MLNATLLKHLRLNPRLKAATIIERDLYVDNVVSSFTNELDLLNYFWESRTLMSNAGMNQRSWTSNSDNLRHTASTVGVLDSDELIKILGLRWNPTSDMLSFPPRVISQLDKVTKRAVLKYTYRIYDPLGLLSPVTIRTKILLQDLWKKSYDWDVPLPEDIQHAWHTLSFDLNSAQTMTLPRLLLPTASSGLDRTSGQLHVFVDASMASYGAAAYICYSTDARLVMAKNRVAPLKKLTLPQLELMAALIGARLGSHLQKSLMVTDITYRSDNQIVLHWLKSSKPSKKFITNRVSEISNLTPGSSWRYCPTDSNPADLLTRGITADKFLSSSLWSTGPSWLCDTSTWPTWDSTQALMQTTSEEQTTL
ncbi:uncharacterized protein LOC128548811 [Mercenaria mercenaria]|uniref:uncharacterized protein LOC128548811 n=1 Tax=Mercenaria mercenaria TaxID=6596 RepID=UPI00234F255B|nr:uncharacterized protein LOC128548811 [Mercenaria mercenaria]